MVTEPTREAEQNSPPSDFTIHDTTSPEQLEVEAEQDAQAAQPEAAQVAEVDGEQVPLGRDTEVQPVVQPEPVPQQSQPVQQEQPRLYTPEEVAKMQSAWAKQINEERRLRQQEVEAKAVEDGVEEWMVNQEAQLTPTYGAEEARRMVRNPENERAVRAQVNTMAENVRLQQQMQQIQSEREQQAAITVANQLATRYGLDVDDQRALLQVQTPQAMQAMAQRLGQKTQMLRARVPAETPRTTLESGLSSGSGPEDPTAKLQRLRSKPGYEWTPEEREFMRTGR